MLISERIQALPPEAKISLRRSFGKRIGEISMRDAISFYSIVPNDLTAREEENLFFVVTMYCYYQEQANRGLPFSDAISRYYGTCRDAGKRDLLALMDASYDLNGTFLTRMYSLIRKMCSEEIYVDASDLYSELKFWDAKSKQRKVKIAKKITGVEEGVEQ